MGIMRVHIGHQDALRPVGACEGKSYRLEDVITTNGEC